MNNKEIKLKADESLGFINDFHISKEKIQDAKDNWSEFLNNLKKRGISKAVIGGDLFEARNAQSLAVLIAVQDMFELAKESNIDIYVANGNHDKVNQEDINGYCHLYKYMDNVNVVDVWDVFVTPTSNIFVLAYFPETGSLRDKISDIIKSNVFQNGKRNVLYAHAGVLGALGKENKSTEISKASFSAFDIVYMGHYHCKSSIGNVHYIGASRQFTFGENTIKGYNICDTNGDLEFVQNKVNNRMVTIDIDFDELTSLPDLIQNTRAEHNVNQNFDGRVIIRARIKADKNQTSLIDKESIKNMGADRLEIISKVIKTDLVDSNFYKKYDQTQIIDSYNSFCKEKNKDPKIGLKYLQETKSK